MSKINIAIADDYKIFREGIKKCIAGDKNMNVVLETDNGEDLVIILKQQSRMSSSWI